MEGAGTNFSPTRDTFKNIKKNCLEQPGTLLKIYIYKKFAWSDLGHFYQKKSRKIDSNFSTFYLLYLLPIILPCLGYFYYKKIPRQ